jgi:hypothetical protein
MYDEEPNHAFYYNILGNLIKVDVTNGQNYPKKTYGYSRFGNLISVALEVSENEQFVYDENKNESMVFLLEARKGMKHYSKIPKPIINTR